MAARLRPQPSDGLRDKLATVYHRTVRLATYQAPADGPDQRAATLLDGQREALDTCAKAEQFVTCAFSVITQAGEELLVKRDKVDFVTLRNLSQRMEGTLRPSSVWRE
jgi:hypothetical protein